MKNTFMTLIIVLVGGLFITACDSYQQESRSEGANTSENTSLGTDIDDGVITTKVKAALLKDIGLESLDIKVETRKGTVQLSGFTENTNQIDRAIAIAQEIDGVRNVDNKMDIKTTDTSVGVKIDDSVITTKVKAALLSDPTIKGSDISVVTRDAEVQLSGFVENQAQIDRAIELAGKVDGVKNVTDEMSIKQ